MARKNSPQYVISSYQKKSKVLPFLIWGIAAIIFGAGILILIFWFGGDNGISISNLFASKTPTPTETFTPTPTVPTSTPTVTPFPTDTLIPTNTATPEGPQMYTVKEGDNCWSIAVDQFGVSFDVFMAINNLTECSIRAGDDVIIPGNDTQLPTETPFPLDQYTSGQQIEYTVQLNDSYNEIAQKFNTSLESLKKLNNIEDIYAFPNYNTVLVVAVNIVTPTPTAVPTFTAVPASQ